MEGKSGILLVLIVLTVLLLAASVAFGVLYGVKATQVFANYETNLYICLICGGLFILSSIGITVARNARITADNTYDILCRIDALLKEKGLTEADLARRDFKTGEKIAKREAQLKAKMEAKALKEVAQEEKKAKIEESKVDAVNEAVAEATREETPVVEEQKTAEAPTSVVPETPVESAPTIPTLSYEEWKAGLDGMITCGECGGAYSVNKTKSGKILIICQTARREPNKCSNKTPITVENFATEFVSFFRAFFGEPLNAFDMAVFKKTISSVTIKDGQISFKANEDVL